MALTARVAGALLTLALVLGGCLGSDEPERGSVGFVEGFLGGVVADEPRAALVGRDILSAGGTAADAAVATYFALAVTLPSSASLGGGGVCLAHDTASGTTSTLEFLPRAPGGGLAGAERPTAIPGNVRGFYALHAKHGRLRWSQLVTPAENLARFGIQVSRAFAHDLAQVETALMSEQEARRVLARPDGGGLVRERDFLAQLDLAAVLSRLRTQGPGDFYTGRTTSLIVEGVRKAGGNLDRADLAGYAPRWRDTIRIPFSHNETLHFAAPPAIAGAVASEMWAMLAQNDRFVDAAKEERIHLLAETAERAFADRATWLGLDVEEQVAVERLATPERMTALMAKYDPRHHTPAASFQPAPRPQPENAAATSFVVVDNEGGAVACTLTMNNLFGTGRFAPGTGILLAAAPDPAVGRGPFSLGPMMLINRHVNEFYFAAAASGGVAAPSAMVQTAAWHLLAGVSVERAQDAGRVHHGGAPDITYHEEGLPPELARTLAERGHNLEATPTLGRVQVISCTGGIPPKPETCAMKADPRGFGLAAFADQ